MAEVGSSCPPFCGDERSLMATFSGVFAVLSLFLAQARGVARGSRFDHVKTELQAFLESAVSLCKFGPGIGLNVAFRNWNETRNCGRAQLRNPEFWPDGETKPIPPCKEGGRGNTDKWPYWISPVEALALALSLLMLLEVFLQMMATTA